MSAFDPLREWLGIPPQARPVDYYTLLGLRRFEEDVNVILQALQARQNLVQRHLHGPHAKEASELLSIFGQAQACLLDRARKAAYDNKLRGQSAAASTAQSRPATSAPPLPTVAGAPGVSSVPSPSTAPNLSGTESHGPITDTSGEALPRAKEPITPPPEPEGYDLLVESESAPKAPGDGRSPGAPPKVGTSAEPVGIVVKDRVLSTRSAGVGWREYAQVGALGAIAVACILGVAVLIYRTIEGTGSQGGEEMRTVAATAPQGMAAQPASGAQPICKTPPQAQPISGPDQAPLPVGTVMPQRPRGDVAPPAILHDWPVTPPRAEPQRSQGQAPGSAPNSPQGQGDSSSTSAGASRPGARSEAASGQANPRETSGSRSGTPPAEVERQPAGAPLGTPGQGRNPISPELSQKLEQIIKVSFLETPLNEAVSVLSDASGVPIRLDQKALIDVGVFPDTPVTFETDGMPLREALEELIAPLDLMLEFRPDGILITAEKLDIDPTLEFAEGNIPQFDDLVLLPEAKKLAEICQFAQQPLPQPHVTDETIAEILIRAWGVKGVSGIQAAAMRVRYAKEFLLLLEVFRRLVPIPPEEEDKLNSLEVNWKVRAELDLIRLGTEWVTPKEWLARKNGARQAFVRGLLMLRQGFSEGIREVGRAAKLDPEFASAHFVVGLGYTIGEANYQEGANAFQQSLRRNPGAIPVLNNLAICRYRLGAMGTALSYLRRAVRAGGSPEVTHNIHMILKLDRDNIRPLPPATRKGFADLLPRAVMQHGADAIDSRNVPGFVFMRLNRPMLVQDGWIDPSPEPIAVTLTPKGPRGLELTGFGTAFLVAPGYALTNRHVVKGGKAFALFPSGADLPIAWVTKTTEADRDDVDLAILHCPNLKGRPLRLKLGTDFTKVQSEIAVVGYPRPDELGSDVKRNYGLVVAEPAEKIGNYYILSLNATDLSGNSGGPVVSRSGSVIGVFTIGLRFSPYLEEVYAAAPCSLATSLFQKLGIRVATTRSDDEHFSWEEILPEIEESVFLVARYSQPIPESFMEAIQQMAARKGLKGLELCDPWCTRCNGLGFEDCPNRMCGRGVISTTRERVLGHDPSTGRPIVVREPTRVPCRVCGAEGRVPCATCGGSRLLGGWR